LHNLSYHQPRGMLREDCLNLIKNDKNIKYAYFNSFILNFILDG